MTDPTTCRAVVVSAVTDPPSIALGTLAVPPPGPGQVALSVAAAGVNFADTLMIVGKYQRKPPPPFAPGLEVAGTVVALGPDVTSLAVGDRVQAFTAHGGMAERVNVLADRCYRIPDAMDFVTGAGFGVIYGTAYGALAWRARAQPGETVLVTGAAGGVGLAAVEVAKAMGCRVIAGASSAEKLALARAHGADDGVDYASEDLRTRLKDLTGGKGVDVVLDMVGGDVFDAVMRAMAWDGRIVVIGFAAGRIPSAPMNLLLVKNTATLGFGFGSYRENRPDLVKPAMAQLFDWWAAGQLKPHVTATFDLARYQDALDLLTGRRVTGKVVLTAGAGG